MIASWAHRVIAISRNFIIVFCQRRKEHAPTRGKAISISQSRSTGLAHFPDRKFPIASDVSRQRW